MSLAYPGQCFRYRNTRFGKAGFAVELEKLEASVAELGKTVQSVYDEAYIARKEEALREAGVPLVLVEIEPEGRSIRWLDTELTSDFVRAKITSRDPVSKMARDEAVPFHGHANDSPD